MAHHPITDIVERLRSVFVFDFDSDDQGEYYDCNYAESDEAAREIEALRRRLNRLGVETPSQERARPLTPTEIEDGEKEPNDPADIVTRLRLGHDFVEGNARDIIDCYHAERREAAEVIEALRARLAALGVSTAADLPQAGPKVVRLRA